MPIEEPALTPRIPHAFRAVMDVLTFSQEPRKEFPSLVDKEWESILRFCELAHLTLPLAERTNGSFPQWVIDRLQRNISDNGARFERVKATYQETSVALDRAGVEYLVLKGFTQSTDYVSNPRLRVQYDLDFYCPQEMIERAQTVLQAIGYRPEMTLDYSRADHQPSLVRKGNWRFQGNDFDPDMPLSIELHFCLWNERTTRITVPEVDNFWGRRTIRSLEGLSFPALSRVDHLGHFALHILRNLLSGDWAVHHVYELASFLNDHANDDEFWQAWKLCHGPKLRALQLIAFAHAKAWFHCQVHDAVEVEMQALPSKLHHWLQCFTGSSLEGMFCPNKDRIWLHAALLESSHEQRKVVWNGLIPSKVRGIHHPATRLNNRRKLPDMHPIPRYVIYLVSRFSAHARVIPRTLLHGLRWWMLQRQFGLPRRVIY